MGVNTVCSLKIDWKHDLLTIFSSRGQKQNKNRTEHILYFTQVITDIWRNKRNSNETWTWWKRVNNNTYIWWPVCAISSFRPLAAKRRHAKRRKEEKTPFEKTKRRKRRKTPCVKTTRRNNATRKDENTKPAARKDETPARKDEKTPCQKTPFETPTKPLMSRALRCWHRFLTDLNDAI